MKSTTLLLFLFLTCNLVARSAPQEKTVTGTVKDAITGEPIPGVYISVEGTQTGTVTDSGGNFILSAPGKGAIIVFSFIGYDRQTVFYDNQIVIDIKLVQYTEFLSEVVVTGYGTQKKSDLTGSISQVKAKDIEKSSAINVEEALQGKIPGLVVTSTSGAPGSEPVVRIRGIGTVNNNNPVYVIDGVLVDPSQGEFNLNFLNPNDISSIEVLKDASAQAIYGSRGANGVILISTKKGSEGEPTLTFNTTFGFRNIIKLPAVLNREDFKDYMITCSKNGYLRTHPGYDSEVPLDTLISLNPTLGYVLDEYNKNIYTDWYNEVIRKNVMNQNYNLTVKGGTKYAHYLADIGYLNEDGAVNKFSYKRYSLRINTDFNVGKYVTVGENLGLTYDKRQNNDYNGPIGSAMGADPLMPAYQPKDSVNVNDMNYIYDRYAVSEIGGANPLLDIELANWVQSRLMLVGNLFGEITLLKDLKFRTSLGLTGVYNHTSDYSPQFYISSRYNHPVSTVSEHNGLSYGWLLENTLTYAKKLGFHSLTALLGFTSEYSDNSYSNASKQGTPGNYPELRTFDAATLNPNLTGTFSVITMMSYLGRLNYAFHDRYLLTASVRSDGSSKFGIGHKWGTFPSFSLGWNVSNEDFFRNLKLDFISNIKIRGGWGQIGNSSLPVNYAYVSQVSSNAPDWGYPTRYVFGGQVYQGYTVSTIGTPGITWETTQQTNIGIDLAFFRNALSLTADYYIKDTKDMLLQVPLPAYSGYSSSASPYINAGSVRNKGIELIVGYTAKTGDLTYTASVNGSAFRNRVTRLEMGNKPIDIAFSRTEVGKSIGYYRGWAVDGIFQTEEDVQKYKGPDGTVLQPNAHAGDIRFKNLNNDETINDADQTMIGSPWPKLTYGFNIILGYKAFDLTLFFQGSYGNDIFDIGMWRHMNFIGSGQEFEYIFKNAWNGSGSSNSNPLLSTVDVNNNYRASTYFVEDGSYLRLKNLQIGYNIPKRICGKLKISNGRIWTGGTNLLTFTKYRGIDPEVGANSTPLLEAGYDWNNMFPQSREISVGLTVTF
jgi:TonB-linked SusC/RagA family outer membrane protein